MQRQQLSEIRVTVSLAEPEDFDEFVKYNLYVFNTKSLSISATQTVRFSNFRSFRSSLLLDGSFREDVPFPQTYAKSKLGFGLTDVELSRRVSGLEAWFRSALESLPAASIFNVEQLHGFLFPSSAPRLSDVPMSSEASSSVGGSSFIVPAEQSTALLPFPDPSRHLLGGGSLADAPSQSSYQTLRSLCIANTLLAAAKAESQVPHLSSLVVSAALSKAAASERRLSLLHSPPVPSPLSSALRSYVDLANSLSVSRSLARAAVKREVICRKELHESNMRLVKRVHSTHTVADVGNYRVVYKSDDPPADPEREKEVRQAMMEAVTAVHELKGAADRLAALEEEPRGEALKARFREGLGLCSVRRAFSAFEDDRVPTPNNPPSLPRDKALHAVAAVLADGKRAPLKQEQLEKLLEKVAPNLSADKALSFSQFESLCDAALKSKFVFPSLSGLDLSDIRADTLVDPPLNPFAPHPPLALVRALLAEDTKTSSFLLSAHSKSVVSATSRLTACSAALALALSNEDKAKVRVALLARRAADVAADRWTAARVFVAFDNDGSGTLDRAELGAALAAAVGRRVGEEEVDSMMKRFDESGDGTLQFEEFEGMEKALRGDLARAFVALLWRPNTEEKGVTRGRRIVEEIEASLSDVCL